MEAWGDREYDVTQRGVVVCTCTGCGINRPCRKRGGVRVCKQCVDEMGDRGAVRVMSERASSMSHPKAERAKQAETPKTRERATVSKTPTGPERAM